VYKKNKMLEFAIKYKIIAAVSPYAVDLLHQMLKPNPFDRITPDDALNSSFFGENKNYYRNAKIEE
jgi:hypothetical protein